MLPVVSSRYKHEDSWKDWVIKAKISAQYTQPPRERSEFDTARSHQRMVTDIEKL